MTRVCVVLDTTRDNRALELIAPFTRCVRAGDVLEVIATDDTQAAPGRPVDHVAGIAFSIAETSGVVMVGDEVTSGDDTIGVVVGFDVSHEPNHFNVVVRASPRRTGRDSGIALADPVIFSGTPAWP